MKSSTPLALSIGAICLLLQSTHATLLFSEGFNYTPGNNLGGSVNPGNSTAWTGGSPTLAIGSTTLSYPGLTGLPGNDLVYTPNGTSSSTSINTYSAVTSGSIYYSFLIDCTTLPTANNYITSLNGGTSVPSGSGDALAFYVGASGTGWKIGVRTTGGGSGANYAGTTLQLNTTYLVVGELTLGSSSTASLFLNPIAGDSQPASANATQSTTTAITSIDDVGFKAQTATSAGDFMIGNLNIATTWDEVTVPEPSFFALAGVGALALARFRRQR